MILTVDLSNSYVEICLFENEDLKSNIFSQKFDSDDFQNYKLALTQLNDCIGKFEIHDMSKIMISIAGEVSNDNKNVLGSYSYKKWENKPIYRDLKNMYGVEAFIENDAVVTGVGEYNYESTNQNSSFGTVFFSKSAGIGAMAAKKFNENLMVHPIEIGHIVVVPDGKVCQCGQKGCLESYTSGRSFIEEYDVSAFDLTNEEAQIMAARYLTQALMNVLIFFPVEKLIFSGEVDPSKASFLSDMVSLIEQMLNKRYRFSKPKLEISKLNGHVIQNGLLALINNKQNIIRLR